MNISKASQKKLLIIFSAILVIAAIIISFILGARINRIKNSLDLGRQYLNELDYKSALFAFEGVLQIDGRNVEAALAISDIYRTWGMYEEALSVIDKTISKRPDERLTTAASELQDLIPKPDDIIEIEDETLAVIFGRVFEKSPDEITQSDLDRITEIYYASFMWPSIRFTLDDGTEFGEILLDANGNVLEDYDYENAVASYAADLNPETAAVFVRCRRASIAFDQFVPSEAFSLDDLAVLKNLTHVSMFASTIDNFSFIPTLPRLESLALDMCTSDDYSAIFVSSSLKSLKIEAEDEFGTDEDTAAPIDLTGIGRMTDLETLEIKSDGKIIGISEIASMTALKHLKFQVPQNGDLSILTPLTDLETLILLDVYGMTLDIAPLTDKIHLKKFSFNGASIADLKPFGTMISLQTLNLSGMSLNDISALSGMTGLEYLKLSDNDITDISPLSTMPNLIWVELENNRISDLSPLSDKAQLNQLRLTNNSVTDLSGLDNLPELEYLFIKGNPITSVAPLASLPALIDLRIDDTAIDDRAHISHVRSLNTNSDYWGGSPFN